MVARRCRTPEAFAQPSQPSQPANASVHCATLPGVHSATPLSNSLSSSTSIHIPSSIPSYTNTFRPSPPSLISCTTLSTTTHGPITHGQRISILPRPQVSPRPRTCLIVPRQTRARTTQDCTRTDADPRPPWPPSFGSSSSERHLGSSTRLHCPLTPVVHHSRCPPLVATPLFPVIHFNLSSLLSIRVSFIDCLIRDSPTDPLALNHDGRYRRVRLPLQGEHRPAVERQTVRRHAPPVRTTVTPHATSLRRD